MPPPPVAVDPALSLDELMRGMEVRHVKVDGASAIFVPPPNGVGPWINVKNQDFQQVLLGWIYSKSQVAVSASVLTQATRILLARGYGLPVQPTAHRVYAKGDKVWVYLGPDSEYSVEITPDGWHLIKNPPVLFMPPKNAATLPVPQRGGSVDLMRGLLPNLRDEDWPSVVGFMISTYLPDSPFPILMLYGPKGSGKSSVADLIRDVCDPVKGPAARMGLPRTSRDFWSIVNVQHLPSFDNISELSSELADCLCKASTGTAQQSRQLYTQSAVHTIQTRNPVMLNGIPMFVQRTDLASRTIFVPVQPLPECTPGSEPDLRAEFQRRLPMVLGAIFDAVSMALRDHRGTTVRPGHRLFDAARFVTAAEPSLGFADGTIVAAWNESQRESTEDMGSCDPVAFVLERIVSPSEPWVGSASALLAAAVASSQGAAGKPLPRDFPRTAGRLGDHLCRNEDLLKQSGFKVEKTRTSAGRLIRIERVLAVESTPKTVVTRPVGSGSGPAMSAMSAMSAPETIPAAESTSPELPVAVEAPPEATGVPIKARKKVNAVLPAPTADPVPPPTAAPPVRKRGRPKKVVMVDTPSGASGEASVSPEVDAAAA